MSYILLNSYEEYITSLTGVFTEYEGIVFPEFTVLGQVGENATGDIDFSLASVEGYTGLFGGIEFPVFEVVATGYSDPVISGEITYSLGTVSATALVGATGDGVIQFPLAVIAGTSLFVPSSDGDVDFPSFKIEGHAYFTSAELGIRLNTVNFAASQYSGFAFNSMCVFNGEVICADSSGIVRHVGDTDKSTEIVAYFQTPSTDLQTHRQKSFRKVYLEGSSSGNLSVAAVVGGVEGVFATVEALGVVGDNQYVFPLAHTDRGANIGILVKNKNGEDFTVSSIYATIVVGNTLPSGNTIIGRCKITSPSFTVAASG